MDVEKARVADEYCQALRAGDGDVEAVATEEELDIAGDLLAARGGHREEGDLGLLTLKLVDGADANTGREAVLEAAGLGVVGGEDEDVLGPEGMDGALRVGYPTGR
jgi:hypothetical protein